MKAFLWSSGISVEKRGNRVREAEPGHKVRINNPKVQNRVNRVRTGSLDRETGETRREAAGEESLLAGLLLVIICTWSPERQHFDRLPSTTFSLSTAAGSRYSSGESGPGGLYRVVRLWTEDPRNRSIETGGKSRWICAEPELLC